MFLNKFKKGNTFCSNIKMHYFSYFFSPVDLNPCKSGNMGKELTRVSHSKFTGLSRKQNKLILKVLPLWGDLPLSPRDYQWIEVCFSTFGSKSLPSLWTINESELPDSAEHNPGFLHDRKLEGVWLSWPASVKSLGSSPLTFSSWSQLC